MGIVAQTLSCALPRPAVCCATGKTGAKTLLAATSKTPNLTQQVSRAIAWNALLGPLKLVAELFGTLIKFNVLRPYEAGLLSLVSSAASTFGIWVDLGIDRALPRFIPEVDQAGGRVAVRRFMTQIFAVKGLLLALFLAFILAVGGGADALHLGTAEERVALGLNNGLLFLAIMTVATIVVLGSIYDGLMGYLISFFHQRAWNLIGLVSGLVIPLGTGVLILAGFGIPGVLCAMLFAQVVGVSLAIWQVRRAMHNAPVGVEQETGTPVAQKGLWRRFVFYAAMTNVLNLSDWVVRPAFASFLLASSFASVAGLNVAFNLVGTVLGYLYSPLAGVQVPLFTRVRGDAVGLRTAYAGLGRLLVLLLLPGGVGLALLAGPAMLIQYPKYVDVVPAARLLIPLLFLESLLSLGHNVLVVHERYASVTVSRMLALVAAPLLVWAVPRYGIEGAVVALGTGRILSGVAATYMAWRSFPLGFSWGFTGRVALATGAMGLTVWGLLLLPILPQLDQAASIATRLAATVPVLLIALVGALVFGLVLRLLGGILPEDRERLAGSRLPLKRWILKIL